MDWTNILIAACTAIGTVISIITILGRKFEEIRNDIRQIDNRLSRLEGYIQGRDFKSTGTEDKKG
jgi:hypothetical protein